MMTGLVGSPAPLGSENRMGLDSAEVGCPLLLILDLKSSDAGELWASAYAGLLAVRMSLSLSIRAN